MEKNTVSVIIYGQEYTLSGDMPREYIMKLADKVDEKMKEVAVGRNQTLSKTAVLAAMLITDEYYQEKGNVEKLVNENGELKAKVANFSDLWEEAKISLTSSKDEQERVIEALKAKIAEQETLLANTKDMPSESEQMIAELENRCRDIESSFFDLQMENIRLKNELENYREKGY